MLFVIKGVSSPPTLIYRKLSGSGCRGVRAGRCEMPECVITIYCHMHTEGVYVCT